MLKVNKNYYKYFSTSQSYFKYNNLTLQLIQFYCKR